MATLQNFEEIEAWQKTRELVREMDTVSGQGKFEKDLVLRDPMRSCAGWVSLRPTQQRTLVTVSGDGYRCAPPNLRASRESGFSLVTAIFLLVVLAGLGAMMVTFFTAQQQSSALDVLGSRAYQASRAGIEWGAYQVLQNSGVGFAPNCRTGPTTQALPALAGTLAGFSVSVNCSATSAVEAAATLWVYNITSTATRGAAGSADYVERKMQAAIAQ